VGDQLQGESSWPAGSWGDSQCRASRAAHRVTALLLRPQVIDKHELLYYPGIGSAFYMVGHVPVRRGNKESAKAAMAACAGWLQRGCHMFFFPEGTRKIAGPDPIGPFKEGAFRLAVENGVPVLPVTISGARAVLPATGWRLGMGTIRVRVHAPVSTANKSADGLMEEVRNAMLKDMRPEDEVKYTPPSGAAARSTAGEGTKKDR
jgi:1-acyl-sn-glycerol-3-phosphate acyltransferase